MSDSPRREDIDGSDAPTLSGGGYAYPSGPAPILEAGQVFGPYRVIRLVGQGGMGRVYEAEIVESGRRVAVKLMGHTLASEENRARFLREGRLAASINHPNSVYIYGTDEIHGVPVIAMEFSAQGTLKDLIERDGPMDPTAAVDAVFQLIEGLEAAESGGILHRDIKPSNCFVDADGRIKVGDYGLSVSTSSTDTALTVAGTMVGTPAYASPEQMRGRDIDVRSDIYSLGATLYFLLTGRPPFEEKGLVNLLAAVLEGSPSPPHDVRPKVPRGLSEAVLQSMRRLSEDRFASYSELREALEPFSSKAPGPATLKRRFVAHAIDSALFIAAVATGMSVAYATGGIEEGPRFEAISNTVSTFGSLVYFGIMEGLWGASVGKWLMRLRVVDLDGGIPGPARAFGRAVVFSIPSGLALVGGWLIAFGWTAEYAIPAWQIVISAGTLVLYIGMFATVRSTNGLAGVHDLASRTRVLQLRPKTRRTMISGPVEAVSPAIAGKTFGPYTVQETLYSSDQEEVLVGADPSLARPVWIHISSSPKPPVDDRRQDVARLTRPRWLDGNRGTGSSWDVYSRTHGHPLVGDAASGQSWDTVRFWVADLLAELGAGRRDGTLPAVLEAHHLWLGTDGRLRVLDFGCTRTSSGPRITGAADVRETGRFVRALVAMTLDPGAVVPLHATEFLARLERGAFETIDEMAETAEAWTHAPAQVSNVARAGGLAVAAVLTAVFLLPVVIAASLDMGAYATYPEWARLDRHLVRLEGIQSGAETVDNILADEGALEIYVAGTFGGLLTDSNGWPDEFPTTDLRKAIGTDVASRYPSVDSVELAAAEEGLAEYLDSREDEHSVRISWVYSALLSLQFGIVVMLVCGTIAATLAFVFRGGPILKLFGLAVAGPDHHAAGRFRNLFRTIVVWSPWLLGIPYMQITRYFLPDLGYVAGELAMAVTGVALFASGAVWTLVKPCAGIQDRIAGTRVVPR